MTDLAIPAGADLGLRISNPGLSDASPIQSPESGTGKSVAPAFGEVLDSFLQKVDESQHRADEQVEALALGEPVDVHQVMLALNEASNAVGLTLQVRGKILEAYQELMRIPL